MGHTVLITGGTKNIGFSMAAEFSRAGADLVITSSTQESLDQARADLLAMSDAKVLGVVADVRDADAMAAVGTKALGEFGRVDTVINNALVVAKSGLQQQVGADSILDAPRELWDEGMNGYIHGPLALLREVVPSMRQHGGSIINVLSTAAFGIVDGFGVYGTVKAAMWTATRYLAAELAPEIRVNAICPGTISSSGEIEAEGHRPLMAKVPMRRMGTAAETARAAMFLATDATYTTGQVLYTDGGRVALA